MVKSYLCYDCERPLSSSEYPYHSADHSIQIKEELSREEIGSVISNVLDNLRTDGTLEQLKFGIQMTRKVLTALNERLEVS